VQVVDSILDQIKSNITGIENRDDLPDDEKVSKIIKLFAAVCAGVAVQPIPFADIYILTPIQAYMGSRIAAIRGVPVSKSEATTILKEIGGVVGLGLLAQQLAIGAYKTIIPFYGAIVTIPMVFGLTYGIGRVMDAYFIAKAKGQFLSPEVMKEIWKKGRNEGKKAKDKEAAKGFAENIKVRVADPSIRFIRTNIDEIAIIGSLELIRGQGDLGDVDQAALAALMRTTPSIQTIDDAQAYLSDLDDEQINGVVSNVKGVLHEMEFVRLENQDGDDVTAAMFTETNHPGYDVIMTDNKTGDFWEVQLKATDNQGYVEEWIDGHPDGEILVTEEIASEMGLASSGSSNEELTVRVQDFVETLISSENAENLWSLFPGLTVFSISFVVIELYRRHQAGEFSAHEFKVQAARATGIKVAKIAGIIALLGIPGVSVAVGAALIAKMILTIGRDSPPPIMPTPPELTRAT
jgi:uncharacterized protein (DUF697 family)